MLNKEVFQKVLNELGFIPDIDLFASHNTSHNNTQLPSFFSYRQDPHCLAVNAFSVDWKNINFYAFPPFSCLPRTIQKICSDGAKGILIVPEWPNQPWFSQLMQIVINYITIPPRPNLLHLPSQPEQKHPLYKTLALRAAVVCSRY